MPKIIQPTEEELAAGLLCDETLFEALRSFHRDGFLVMENIMDTTKLDGIRDFLLEEGIEIKEKAVPHKAEFNNPTRNFLQSPPTHIPELGSDMLYKNTYVLQVVNAYLGARPQFIYTAGNNASSGGTERQKVHKDCTFLHPEAPYLVAAQTVLCDFTPETGATEVWPGSHLFTTIHDNVLDPEPQMHITPEIVDQRKRLSPPLQVPCKYGGVFLRDMRLWHAGMPNSSDKDRIMLACGYAARWYKCAGTVKLPIGVEHLYPSSDLVEVMSEYLPLDEYEKVRHVITQDQFQTRLQLPDGCGRVVADSDGKAILLVQTGSDELLN